MLGVLQTLALNITTCSLWMEALRMMLLSGSFSTSVRTLKEPLQSTAKVGFLELHEACSVILFTAQFHVTLLFLCSSWTGEDRYSDCLLHDETLPPNCIRGHRLDTDLPTRVHHWASAELC